MRQISAKMILRIFNYEQKHRRLSISTDLSSHVDVFDEVITEDGT